MMEKLIYLEPRLKALLFDEEPVLVDGTYPEIDEDDEGEDLSKKNTFDNSDFPRQHNVWDE